VVGLLAVGTFLVIGGLAEVSNQSTGYDANTNRSLAALGGAVAVQSNTTSRQVRSLMSNLQGQIRQTLQTDLDNAVIAADGEAARAELAAGSAGPGTAAGNFAVVFEDRADAVSDLRAAVYGFLGMQPATTSGAPATDASATKPPALLSAGDATSRIAGAGDLLTRADQLYASVRAALKADPGHARLPGSVWITDPGQWQSGAVASQVDLMATSTTLQGTHYLVLRTIRLSPAPLPPSPTTPTGTSILNPTTQLSVTVVLANQGTVDEPRPVVRMTLANSSSGSSTSHVSSASVASGRSVTLPDARFKVAPGTTYALTVSIDLPAGQTNTLGTATQETLEVAPAT
jgi:hypothetical protein